MKLQINYTCDVCEGIILFDFEKSFQGNKLECPHCGVIYSFSEEDISSFARCYNDLLQKITTAKKENMKESEASV